MVVLLVEAVGRHLLVLLVEAVVRHLLVLLVVVLLLVHLVVADAQEPSVVSGGLHSSRANLQVLVLLKMPHLGQHPHV